MPIYRSTELIHHCSFSEEPKSFKIAAYNPEKEDDARSAKIHRKFTWSDGRKVEAGNLKTVMRFAVSRRLNV